MTEYVLWATKDGAEDWDESIIATRNSREELAPAIEWAQKNGFHNLRVASLDLSQSPDFIGTINK